MERLLNKLENDGLEAIELLCILNDHDLIKLMTDIDWQVGTNAIDLTCHETLPPELQLEDVLRSKLHAKFSQTIGLSSHTRTYIVNHMVMYYKTHPHAPRGSGKAFFVES